MISDHQLADFNEFADRLLEVAADGRPLAPGEVEVVAASVRDIVDAVVAATHAALLAEERVAGLEHLCGAIGRMVSASQIARGDRLGRAIVLALVENDILAEPEPEPSQDDPPFVRSRAVRHRRPKLNI